MFGKALRGALSAIGYDLRRKDLQPSLLNFLRSRQVDVVLDVGANVGQFASELRAGGYSGRIVSFEPIPAVFAQLQLAASADPLWTVHNVGLGEQPGTAQINVSEYSQFSSIRGYAPSAQSYSVGAIASVQQVRIDTLDSFLPSFQAGRGFLKIDTQGFEQQVLRGAARSLQLLQGVQIEVPLVHLYADTWSAADAIAFMHSAGFVLAQVHHNNFHSADPVSAVELDCIFRRISHPIDSP